MYSIFSLTYLTFFVTSIETPAQVHEREEKERTLAQVYRTREELAARLREEEEKKIAKAEMVTLMYCGVYTSICLLTCKIWYTGICQA